MNLLSTIAGSKMENFFPQGWDLQRIDDCCNNPPESIFHRQPFWNEDFKLIQCEDLDSFDMMLGHEIAVSIRNAKDNDKKLALILPVGPIGMYKWVVFFLKEWNLDCGHVYGFNMDEWSDSNGETLPASDPASFQNAMNKSFYGPLGQLTIPERQRNFATKENLPLYAQKIAELKSDGADLVTIFGIGRVFHIAFWEPHFAAEFDSEAEWKEQNYRLGAKLHPLTIEQNALTSFRSRYTSVPATANTIGPGLFLQSDKIIGGCDGVLGRGMQWQGVSLWVTLRYGQSMWIPSSFMPTLPGKLFFLKELAGPMVADCN